MTDEDVVRRFHSIVGVGNVYVLKKHERYKQTWQWDSMNVREFNHIVELFKPYLGERRKVRVVELLTEYYANRDLLNGSREPRDERERALLGDD